MEINSTSGNDATLLDQPVFNLLHIRIDKLLFIIILVLAIFTRFYHLGDRVMSHDENSHVYFSWLLEKGSGYKHDPVTHGPLQFHLIAFSYFLFGDNDLTARLPAALFSIATIAFMWRYKKILGRAGSLIAGFLLLISPYLLYYGRYARNEAFVGLFGVITIWAILSYLETGKPSYLIWLTAATALHFTSKETSFIYTAQALIFLGILLVIQLTRAVWINGKYKKYFYSMLVIGILLIISGFLSQVINLTQAAQPLTELSTAVPAQAPLSQNLTGTSLIFSSLIMVGFIVIIGSLFFLIKGYSLEKLREIRSLDLIIVLFTMVMPMLAPFPVRLLGRNPIDYSSYPNILFVALFVILFAVFAIIIGLVWKPKIWLTNAAVFYSIFLVFYSTLFTNGFGFFTGLVGSLGYWLEQQGVNRGSQPWYYYGLLQIPIYEYIPALGVLFALIKGFSLKFQEEPLHNELDVEQQPSVNSLISSRNLTFALLGFWTMSSLIAFTFAGEKMPWLTFHIALPMILLTAFYLGEIVEQIHWQNFFNIKGLLLVCLAPIFLLALTRTILSLLVPIPPFQGKELPQLEASSTFLAAIISTVFFGWFLIKLSKNWPMSQIQKIAIAAIFGFGSLLTLRTSIMASFINYDDATEYLVYAHSAGGVKTAMKQIEEISKRVTGGLDLEVAYDNVTTYPYWWYLRNYPNQKFYGDNPTRDLRDSPVILVGDENFGKIEPIVGEAYYRYDYIRIWWPNQDYFGLDRERILNAITNAQMRKAIFKIWLYRDYKLFGEVTDKDMSLNNWYPSSRMRLYVRKDIANQIWNYGTSPVEEITIADPYEGKEQLLNADLVIGQSGSGPQEFQKPRDISLAPDGSIYVADLENHRIQHLDQQGNVLQIWGSYGDITLGEAQGGTLTSLGGLQ